MARFVAVPALNELFSCSGEISIATDHNGARCGNVSAIREEYGDEGLRQQLLIKCHRTLNEVPISMLTRLLERLGPHGRSKPLVEQNP